MQAEPKRIILLGDQMSGKRAAASALLGLPADNPVFNVGRRSTEPVSHCGHWFGKDAEDEVTVVATVGFAGGRDPAKAGALLSLMRDLGSITAFVLVLSAEQPWLSEGFREFLRLLEEALGRGIWRQTVVLFTRWYTDERSCRRRKISKAQLRQDVSQLLLKEFEAVASARPSDDPELPCYFVDSEVVLDPASDSVELDAAMTELQRLSALVRSHSNYPTAMADGVPRSTHPVAARGQSTKSQGSAEKTARPIVNASSRSDATAHKQQPSPSQPASLEGLLRACLEGSSDGDDYSDLQLDETFRYIFGVAMVSKLFDIRDEVCLRVGGFRHGQVLKDIDGEELHVIGVLFEDSKIRFAVHGSCKNAALCLPPEHCRLLQSLGDACVVGHREVQELRQFGPPREPLLPTFSFPIGAMVQRRVVKFDIRDEVCLQVGGFRHGDVITLKNASSKTTLPDGTVIGVHVDEDDGRAKLWCQAKGTKGCGLYDGLAEDADWAQRLFQVARRVEVEEVLEDDFQPSQGGMPDAAELIEQCKQQ